MFNLDEQYLKDLGIMDLPEDKRQSIVEGIAKQIQDRVSLRMAEVLSDEQLDELADLGEREEEGREEAQVKWLEQNVPDYKGMVEGVLEEVKGEILGIRAGVSGS